MADLQKIKLKDATLHDYAQALMSADSDSLREFHLEEFFGKTERTLSDSEAADHYIHRKLQYVWERFFNDRGWKLQKATDYGYLNEVPPTLMDIEVEPKKYIKGYKSATLYYVNDQNKMVITITQGPRGGFYYSIQTTEKEGNLFQDLLKYASDNNLYKGKKIDCDCRFLELDNVTWEDVILPKAVIDVVKANINDSFSLRDKLRAYGLSIKRGVILHGEPGVGKTNLCKCLAKDLDCSVLYALPSDFTRITGIKQVCSMAKDLAPCLLIIEDIDWIALDRSSGNASFVMELMNQLDGIESFGDIITLGTTNCLKDLEVAVKNRPGRFDRIIKVNKPAEKEIEKMILRFTNRFVIDESVDLKKLSTSLKGLTGAHIRDLCTTSALFAVKEDSNREGKLLLKKSHFTEAIKEVKDKDYSSYMETQSKKKPLGFGQEAPSPSLEDFIEDSEGML